MNIIRSKTEKYLKLFFCSRCCRSSYCCCCCMKNWINLFKRQQQKRICKRTEENCVNQKKKVCLLCRTIYIFFGCKFCRTPPSFSDDNNHHRKKREGKIWSEISRLLTLSRSFSLHQFLSLPKINSNMKERDFVPFFIFLYTISFSFHTTEGINVVVVVFLANFVVVHHVCIWWWPNKCCSSPG